MSIPPKLRHAFSGDWQMLATNQTTRPMPQPGEVYRLEAPIRLQSEPNARGAWQVKAARVRSQRQAIDALWRANAFWAASWVVEPPVGPPRADTRRSGRFRARPLESCIPARVLITRLAPRELDTDNLAGACKAVRDQVAALLGFDDRSKRCSWEYAQEKAKEYGVRIEVTF